MTTCKGNAVGVLYKIRNAVEAMMKPQILALCLLFGSSGTVAFAGPAEEANAVIDQWAATYSANDRDALVDLYTSDAVLLGTTSPVISEGTEAIRKYFQELPGSGRKNTIVERRTIVLSETSVVGTGFYSFARATENDTPRPSRFTMVVTKRDGRWMIAHHHSSPLSALRQ
ncbi:SgcJ/EcaC family oxidoreductase [Tardiphaga sp. 538_B7_N1_4]|uniref:SgcJ/EcaC family oxidoreductase n=1 Tax=Tardiphaga sp. 538_B7_N1_4 TaxID=3240778 RepID=UPI003F298499